MTTRMTAAFLLAWTLAAGAAEVPGVSQVPYDSATKGAVTVSGTTVDSFQVYKSGKALGAIRWALTGVALDPGDYEVELHAVRLKVAVAVGKKTVIAAGYIEVTKVKDVFGSFQVLKDKKYLLVSPYSLTSRQAFFPGEYDVEVSAIRVAAVVKPGETTTLRTGALVVIGKKHHSYYVTRGKTTCVNPTLLGSPVPLFPGAYSVHGKNVLDEAILDGAAKVVADKRTEIRD